MNEPLGEDRIRVLFREMLNGTLERHEERLAQRFDKAIEGVHREVEAINGRLIDGNGTFGELRAGVGDLRAELTHQRKEIHRRMDDKADKITQLRGSVDALCEKVEDNRKAIEALRHKAVGAAVVAAKSLAPSWADRLERLPPWAQKVVLAGVFLLLVRIGAVSRGDIEWIWNLVAAAIGGGK